MTDTFNTDPAVLERIEEGRVRIHPHHPDWAGPPRSFDALYERVVDVVVPCAGPSPSPVFVGERSPRVCSFCNRDETGTAFSESAHTIPAAFGNRHHFTLEECNECNHENEYLDDVFAQYLAADRVMVGARKRE